MNSMGRVLVGMMWYMLCGWLWHTTAHPRMSASAPIPAAMYIQLHVHMAMYICTYSYVDEIRTIINEYSMHVT